MVAHEFRQPLFGVADEEGVHEGRERFRLGRHRPSGEHQRVFRAPLLGANRQPAEVEHGQDIREGEFVLQGEAHQVEVPQRPPGFEAHERKAPLTEFPLHVRPGAEGPFECQVGLVVHHLVEDLRSQVAHADVVHIGETERHPGADPLVGLLHHGEPLAPGVPRRRLHFVEEGGVRMVGEAHGGGAPAGAAEPPRSDSPTLPATISRTRMPCQVVVHTCPAIRGPSFAMCSSACE